MFEEQAILLLLIVLTLWFICGILIGSAAERAEVKKELKELKALSEESD